MPGEKCPFCSSTNTEPVEGSSVWHFCRCCSKTFEWKPVDPQADMLRRVFEETGES